MVVRTTLRIALLFISILLVVHLRLPLHVLALEEATYWPPVPLPSQLHLYQLRPTEQVLLRIAVKMKRFKLILAEMEDVVLQLEMLRLVELFHQGLR